MQVGSEDERPFQGQLSEEQLSLVEVCGVEHVRSRIASPLPQKEIVTKGFRYCPSHQCLSESGGGG